MNYSGIFYFQYFCRITILYETEKLFSTDLAQKPILIMIIIKIFLVLIIKINEYDSFYQTAVRLIP